MPQGQPPISRVMPGTTGLSLRTYNPTQGVNTCELLAREMPIHSPDRYDDLIRLARRMNVAIHPVSPIRLTASSSVFSWSVLRPVADETGGIAVVNVNDMPAYYLLGYHTSNTKWDGQRREIKVRLKSSGKTVRARREYLAPSAADIAAIRAAAEAPPRPTSPTPIERALGVLARQRDAVGVHLQAALRERALAVAVEVPLGTATSGGWYDGADVEVSASTEGSPAAAVPVSASMTATTTMRTGARGAEVHLPATSRSR